MASNRDLNTRTKKTPRYSDRLKSKVVRAFQRTFFLNKAAAEVGVLRSTVEEWLETDPKFAKRIDLIRRELADQWEQVAVGRAIMGHRKPVIYKGVQAVGHDGQPLFTTEPSDALMLAILKAHHPAYQGKDEVVDKIAGTFAALVKEATSTKPPTLDNHERKRLGIPNG